MAHETTSMYTDAHKRGLPIPLEPGDTLYLNPDGISGERAEITFQSYVKQTALVRYKEDGEEVESGVAAFAERLSEADFQVRRKQNELDDMYARLIRNLSISGEIHANSVEKAYPDGFVGRLHEDERIEYHDGYNSFAYVG